MRIFTLAICFILTALFSYAQVNLNLGLMAHYPFNGNANDASGNGNNPFFNNATLTTDRFGNTGAAYHFNGTNNYMQIPNAATLNFTNKITLVTWVRVTGFYSGTCHGNRIIMKGNNEGTPGNYYLTFDDNAYTNAQNCFIPAPDVLHQNFYGENTLQPPGGYTPHIQTNQWYSVIYTNDGITAKLYINCELKGSGPAGSPAFTNASDLFFGRLNNPSFPYWFNGDLDDVRIYNRAINIDEINVLGGCSSVTPIIINDYTPASAFDKCKNMLTVADASKYKAGDTVLLIQMKGAVIDSTNTATFGNITDYKNTGNYEFNYIKNKSGNLIELKNVITRQYDFTEGKVQLIRVPFYQKLNTSAPLTCRQWDGTTGGVLVFNVADTLNLNADIDVSGKGFAGGIGVNTNQGSTNCFNNNYNYPLASVMAAQKGESVAIISNNLISGKGAPANSGGGGLDHNSGGGGGGNGGAGGFGGYQWDNCGNTPFDNRGIGGRAISFSALANRIFMGGGGGAGHANNIGNLPSSGGNGAGIIIFTSDKLRTNGYKIIANGKDGVACTTGINSDCHEGMGGGGAGGTIVMNVRQHLTNSIIENKGGNGANMIGFAAGGKVGAGGGGGAGVLMINSGSLPAQISNVNTGGANGVNTQFANNPWGATPGGPGNTLYSVVVPIDNVLFKPTFDSAKLHIEVLTCTNFKFWGLTDAVRSQIVKWQWSLGDGYTDSTENFTHNYITPGTYPVKLVATDIYGCVATFKVDLTVLCRCEEIKLTTPNPTRSIITVSGLGCGRNTLILYNMLGQKITQVTGDNASETINVSNLAKGMYIVRIINKDKIVKHIKVEKM